MTSPLADFVAVTFVADADTPAESQPFVGRTLYLPPEYLTAIGSGPANPGKLLGVRGYMRTGVGGREWLMTSPFPPAIVAQLLAIPGGLGWVSVPARNQYRNIAVTMIEGYGIAAPDIVNALTTLYRAAVQNDHAAPPP